MYYIRASPARIRPAGERENVIQMDSITASDESTAPTPEFGGARRIAFYAAVLIGLAVPLLIFQLGLLYPLFGWFDPSAGEMHFLHDVTFMGMMLTAFLATAVQLYRPRGRVAGLQQVALLLAIFLVGIVVLGTTADAGLYDEAPFFLLLFGPAVVAALLHPDRDGLLGRRRAGRFIPVVAGLAVVAAVPLAPYVVDQAALQAGGDEHAAISHYAGMVIYSVAIVGFALLASLRTPGWRIPLYSAAFLALVLGVGSVLHPGLASSGGPMWGGAAVLWALLLPVVGELSARREIEAPRTVGESDPKLG